MKVITYVSSVHDDAPERYRAAARILLPDGSMHPVVFHAGDKIQARTAAEGWWAKQLAAQASKVENARRRAEAMRAGRGRPLDAQTTGTS